MRNLKKVLALVIAFSMMLSVVAFAGYNDVAEDADYAGAVELLSALEIFEGDENGNFNPDKTVSRAEMAALICRATGLEEMAEASKGATAFADVAASHWASGYVNVASSNGIINGIGDGKFAPDATLTYPQAVKMIVYALGFQLMAEDNGGWDAGSIYVANKYKVTEGAAVNATRGNLAILLANAMSTPMMDKTTYGANAEYEVLNGKNDKEYRTLLTNMDIYIATGVVGEKNEEKVDFVVTEDSDDGEFKAGNKTFEFVIGESDIVAYEYQNVDAYVKKSGRKYEVVAVVPSALGESFTLLSDDVKGYEDGKLEYYVDAANSNKTKKFEVEADIPVEYNKDKNTSKDLEDLIADEDVVLTFIDNTADGEYDYLVAYKYESAIVEYVDANRDKIGYAGKTFSIDFEDENATIILADANGNALTLADFEEDDVIAVITDGTKITNYDKYIEIVKLADATITGTVESTWTDSKDVQYVSIDGNDYVNAGKVLYAGDEGTFYIGMTGKIIEFEVSTANLNYGFILEAAYATSAFTKTWQVKMLTADGVAIYEVDEDLAEYAEGKKFEDSEIGAILTALKGWDKDENELAWDKKDIEERFVEFETNKNGQIDEIELADGTLSSISAGAEYKASTNRIDGKALEDDALVLYVDKTDAEDVFATDISFLVDESSYEGYIFKCATHKENDVMIITKGVSPFKAEDGFAIVTKVATTKNEEGDKVTSVTYVQAEEEGVVTFDDDAEAVGATKYDKLGVGDIFMFNATAEGVVTNYLVVAQYNGKDFVIEDGVADMYAAETFGDDAYISTGYIYEIEKKVLFLYDDVEEAVAEFDVSSAVNQYTYDNSGRTTKIVAGDYTATENTEDWVNAEDQTKATPVIFVVIDGELVDLYSANDKVELDAK